jgi:hypothetical protein
MSGPDSGLSSDTCIFINPGSPNFWESADITLNAATSHPTLAVFGTNTVEVTVRKTAGCSVLVPVVIDLFVSKATSGGPLPPGVLPNYSKQITNVGGVIDTSINNPNAIPATGQPVTITWTIATGTPNTDPDGPGHRCLVARCYPLGLAPDGSDFHVQQGTAANPGDRHVAQRNICIVTCSGPGAAMAREQAARSCEFDVAAANGNLKAAQPVTIRAVMNIRPDKGTLDVLLPQLQQIPGFKRIATEPMPDLNLRFQDFPDVKVIKRPSGCLSRLLALVGLGTADQPTYEANIQLQPAQLTTYTVVPDFSKSQFGDAHILNLTQVGADQQPQGGLTLVFVVI